MPTKQSAASPSSSDSKTQALQRQGTLYPHPEKVLDPLFVQHDFFDLGVGHHFKYEMLRSVQPDAQSTALAAAPFGLSRPAFYQAQLAFQTQGLAGLIPHKRGPRHGHKLSEECLAFVEELRGQPDPPSIVALVQRLRESFGLVVHPRSLERALARRKKNRLPPTPRASTPDGQ